MNYEQMSDFEINKLVADLRWPEFVKYEQYEKLRVQVPDGDDFYFDFNNPEDAWPIIERMLSQDVTLAINSHGVMSSNFGSKFNGFSFDVEGSPLRAIMIGYLMMQEQECNT